MAHNQELDLRSSGKKLFDDVSESSVGYQTKKRESVTLNATNNQQLIIYSEHDNKDKVDEMLEEAIKKMQDNEKDVTLYFENEVPVDLDLIESENDLISVYKLEQSEESV